MTLRRRALGALVAAGLLLPGCFREPVQEELELRFRADGALELTARVRVSDSNEFPPDRAVRERTEALRERLDRDGFGWPERLQRLEPARRTAVSEHLAELLVERRFRALVDPARLDRLLDDGLVRLRYQRRDDGPCELAFLVEPGSRADRRQQELMSRLEGQLAAAYLDYLHAAGEFVEFLDERPWRAAELLWHALGDGAGEVVFTEERDEPDLDEEEAARVARLTEAMVAVLEIFAEVPEGEQRHLDGLSRLVHDPFAFDIQVLLPVAPLEVEGFRVLAGGRRLAAPRRSLTEALESLTSRWLEPDWLIVLWTGPWRDEELKIDLEELAARPRRADPPLSTGELREALSEALRPPPILRVRWLPPAAPGEDELDWEAAPQR